MNDGSRGTSIEDLLDSVGYNSGGHVIMNQMILFYLEEDGGCDSCISIVRRAT